jgi:hypothetical protein
VEKKQAVSSEQVEKTNGGKESVVETKDEKRKVHKKSFMSRFFGKTQRLVDVIPPS